MKNKVFINAFIAILLSSIVLSPSFAMASNGKGKGITKNNDKVEKVNQKQENDDDNDDKNEKKCVKAYGHLFAFGWLKKNEKIELDSDCILPFGIAKKFRSRNNTASSTDTVFPVISNINSTTTAVRATVVWKTDEKADSAIFWSTNNVVDVNNPNTPRITNNDKVLNHKLVINGLSASTTYNAVARSKDSAGNTTYSSQFSFTTKSPVVIGDTTAPTISTVVAVVSTSTLKVGWQTNEPSTSKIYYSTTTPLVLTASSTNFIESASLTNVHLIEVPNLSTSTTYYVIIESKDAASNTQKSNQFQITTSS